MSTINKLSYAVLMMSSIGFMSCSAKFGFNSNPVSANTAAGAPGVLCNPLDAQNIVSETDGLQGKFYYVDPGAATYSDSADYIANGHLGSAELFLSQVNVPTRDYLMGFTNGDGSSLTDGTGQALTENYALALKSRIKLGASDSAGMYQLAVISDDGSTLSLADQSGNYQSLVANEGLHSTGMGCATTAVSVDAASRLAMSLTYFQGPRDKVSLIMMWRKLPDNPGAADFADVECGRSDDQEFFDGNSNPNSNFQDLQARGWKVMSPDNFELQDGYNKCGI